MKLVVDAVYCKFGKISNNTLQMGEAGFVPEFTIPVTGLMLSPEQLNETMGDPLTWRSWYNHSPPALPKPCDWWAHSKGEFPIPDEFEGDWLEIQVTGDRILEFLGEEKGDKKTPAFRISKAVLTPLHGGNTEVKFHLHVRPGIGKENLVLQEHQHSEVRLSFSETKPQAPDNRQQKLELAPPEKSAKVASTDPTTSQPCPAVEGSETQEQSQETLGTQKSEPTSGSPSDAPLDGESGTATEGADECALDKPASENYDKGSEIRSPSGEVIALRSGAQIDAAMEERARKKKQREAARLLIENRNSDLNEFEKNLSRDIQEHQQRPPNLIDGTGGK